MSRRSSTNVFGPEQFFASGPSHHHTGYRSLFEVENIEKTPIPINNVLSNLFKVMEFAKRQRILVSKIAALVGEWSASSSVVFILDSEDNAPLTIIEKLKDTKNTFGLTVVDFARILKNERQTVYNWLNGGPINYKSYQRLEDIFQVVQMWKKTEMGEFPPAKLMAQTLRNLPSILEVLSEETINFDIIPQCIESLVALVKAQKLEMDAKLNRLAQRGQQMSSKDYEKLGELINTDARDLPELRKLASKKSPWE